MVENFYDAVIDRMTKERKYEMIRASLTSCTEGLVNVIGEMAVHKESDGGNERDKLLSRFKKEKVYLSGMNIWRPGYDEIFNTARNGNIKEKDLEKLQLLTVGCAL